eukprot:3803679-Rhodomonas_salina.1
MEWGQEELASMKALTSKQDARSRKLQVPAPARAPRISYVFAFMCVCLLSVCLLSECVRERMRMRQMSRVCACLDIRLGALQHSTRCKVV